MGKRKVIGDSDDDESVDDTPPPPSLSQLLEQDSSPRPQHGTTVVSDNLQQSAGPSTASTERLNRDISNARRALVEPTPDNSLPSTKLREASRPSSPNSPSISRSNIRRTKTTVEKPSIKKPSRALGSQIRDHFDIHSVSDGELDVTARKEVDLQGSKRKPSHDTYGRTWALSSEDVEILGSRVDAADNVVLSASFMPPPASKPTSFEQTQGWEGTANMDPLLKVGSFESDSLYSDVAMGKSTESNWSQAREVGYSDSCTDSSRKRSREEMEATNGQPTGLTEPGRSIMVDNRAQPSHSPHESGMMNYAALHAHRSVHSMATTTESVALLPRQVQNDEAQDELSFSAPTTDIGSKCQNAEPPRMDEGTEGHMDELGSDDHAIDWPKDCYIPRPSKSRSGHGNAAIVVPADYSKRPEAVAKKKRKLSRRKTTAFHELIPKEEDEDGKNEDVNQPDIEVRKSKDLKPFSKQDELHLGKLKRAEGNQDHIQDQSRLISESAGSKKQRGRPRKAVKECQENKNFEHEEGSPEIDNTAEDIVPSRETGPKPAAKPAESKKQRGRPRKGAPENAKDSTLAGTGENSEHDDEVSRPVEEENITAAKKSRKKDKTTEVPMAISEEVVHDNDELETTNDDPSGRIKVLEVTQADVIHDRARSPSPPSSNAAPPETPHKPCAAQKGPDKHSPISSGKVAYRVGLSKKARIEPLLRIVRKC